MEEVKPNKYIYYDDLSSLALDIHDFFGRFPLATDEDEGYDHWKSFFESIMKNYIIEDYRNYN